MASLLSSYKPNCVLNIWSRYVTYRQKSLTEGWEYMKKEQPEKFERHLNHLDMLNRAISLDSDHEIRELGVKAFPTPSGDDNHPISYECTLWKCTDFTCTRKCRFHALSVHAHDARPLLSLSGSRQLADAG
ncbi:Hypothetical predicted protein [Cloeon dipterum]|uniref:Uncharacterized protein n=1 Tax=Cloeon dipterum TaxID=197152 RepID=A0A8S1CUY8_9INSE|nr:Hypothetical predicted protein [Cloeon dipterum]